MCTRTASFLSDLALSLPVSSLAFYLTFYLTNTLAFHLAKSLEVSRLYSFRAINPSFSTLGRMVENMKRKFTKMIIQPAVINHLEIDINCLINFKRKYQSQRVF